GNKDSLNNTYCSSNKLSINLLHITTGILENSEVFKS
ncbi:unnamed protein product, partial [marine sediment metagenome]